jgi:hypothetical protein
VGNLEGHSSGEWYEDQQEVTWEALGIEPELTTVTKRIRRVATFSEEQLFEALRANDPDWIAVNFLNYLTEDMEKEFGRALFETRAHYSKHFGVIGGYGPGVADWRILDDGRSIQ